MRLPRRGLERGGRGTATLLVAACVACSAGDGAGGPEQGLPPEDFVEAIVELREAERKMDDEATLAEVAELQREILDRRGITAEELRAFVRAHSEDLGTQYGVWRAINERLVHETTPEEERRLERGGPTPPTPDSVPDPD